MNLLEKHPFISAVLLYVAVSFIIYLLLGDSAGGGKEPISEDSSLVEWGCEPGRC